MNLATDPKRKAAAAEAGHNHPRNSGIAFNEEAVLGPTVNLSAVERRTASLPARRSVKKEYQAAWLVKAIQCIDLTTLAGDDTPARACSGSAPRRSRRCAPTCVEALGLADDAPKVGAVCVYPTMVKPAVEGADRLRHSRRLGRDRLPRRPDAAGPAPGRNPPRRRRGRRRDRHRHHPRPCADGQDWPALYDEIAAMRAACGPAHLKAILATGDLKTLRNVYTRLA